MPAGHGRGWDAAAASVSAPGGCTPKDAHYAQGALPLACDAAHSAGCSEHHAPRNITACRAPHATQQNAKITHQRVEAVQPQHVRRLHVLREWEGACHARWCGWCDGARRVGERAAGEGARGTSPMGIGGRQSGQGTACKEGARAHPYLPRPSVDHLGVLGCRPPLLHKRLQVSPGVLRGGAPACQGGEWGMRQLPIRVASSLLAQMREGSPPLAQPAGLCSMATALLPPPAPLSPVMWSPPPMRRTSASLGDVSVRICGGVGGGGLRA